MSPEPIYPGRCFWADDVEDFVPGVIYPSWKGEKPTATFATVHHDGAYCSNKRILAEEASMKASEGYTKLAALGLEDLGAAFAGVALSFSPETAMLALQSALAITETGVWDEDTERAVLHQGQGATLRRFREEEERLQEGYSI